MRKHDVNIKKGKLINIQIALIAIFSFAYVMHQVYTFKSVKKSTIAEIKIDDDDTYVIYPRVTAIPNATEAIVEEKKAIAKAEIIKKLETPKPKEIIDPKITNEEVPSEEVKKESTNSTTTDSKAVKTKSTTAPTNTTAKAKKPSAPKIHNRKTVDVLPIFPGCHKMNTNDERAACFQEKVQRLINRRFDKSIGEDRNLNGIQRIFLYFEIDKTGEIVNIRATNQHSFLKDEAIRVAKTLPKMQPAKSGNDSVKMAYNVPIVFSVDN